MFNVLQFPSLRYTMCRDNQDLRGDFLKYDIIGDIHGCFDELLDLIAKLGYEEIQGVYVHPEGRQLVFVGDAMDLSLIHI